mmetsp:Transcript_77253/g.145632  ORF Transcript_77253/g.145632 Transcript_77253/m.145632 type:complete len:108 (+) Transcript_77253:81-404(+)
MRVSTQARGGVCFSRGLRELKTTLAGILFQVVRVKDELLEVKVRPATHQDAKLEEPTASAAAFVWVETFHPNCFHHHRTPTFLFRPLFLLHDTVLFTKDKYKKALVD